MHTSYSYLRIYTAFFRCFLSKLELYSGTSDMKDYLSTKDSFNGECQKKNLEEDEITSEEGPNVYFVPL